MSLITFKTDVEYEFDVECSQCGNTLDADMTTNRRGNVVKVTPCPYCLKEKEEMIESLQGVQDALSDEIDILKTKEIFINILQH
jgi:hypothetical protein